MPELQNKPEYNEDAVLSAFVSGLDELAKKAETALGATLGSDDEKLRAIATFLTLRALEQIAKQEDQTHNSLYYTLRDKIHVISQTANRGEVTPNNALAYIQGLYNLTVPEENKPLREAFETTFDTLKAKDPKFFDRFVKSLNGDKLTPTLAEPPKISSRQFLGYLSALAVMGAGGTSFASAIIANRSPETPEQRQSREDLLAKEGPKRDEANKTLKVADINTDAPIEKIGDDVERLKNKRINGQPYLTDTVAKALDRSVEALENYQKVTAPLQKKEDQWRKTAGTLNIVAGVLDAVAFVALGTQIYQSGGKERKDFKEMDITRGKISKYVLQEAQKAVDTLPKPPPPLTNRQFRA